MTKEEMKNKIYSNEIVKQFVDIIGDKANWVSFYLIGGAVIDIINDKPPKDYDFIGGSDSIKKIFKDNGFDFICSTNSADTYSKGDIVVQFLNTPLENFDFKISQSRIRISGKTNEFIIDEDSLNKKQLIPVDFKTKRNALNSLRRIPHWKKKGYEIHDLTYLSLLNVVSKQNALKS